MREFTWLINSNSGDVEAVYFWGWELGYLPVPNKGTFYVDLAEDGAVYVREREWGRDDVMITKFPNLESAQSEYGWLLKAIGVKL